MKPGSDKILIRAERALQRAQSHLAGGGYERALERAYHCIVHVARVVLNENGESARAHAAVLEKVQGLLAGDLDLVAGALRRGLALRDADEGAISDEDAESLVAQAAAALDSVRRVLIQGHPREEGEPNVRRHESNPGQRSL